MKILVLGGWYWRDRSIIRHALFRFTYNDGVMTPYLTEAERIADTEARMLAMTVHRVEEVDDVIGEADIVLAFGLDVRVRKYLRVPYKLYMGHTCKFCKGDNLYIGHGTVDGNPMPVEYCPSCGLSWEVEL